MKQRIDLFPDRAYERLFTLVSEYVPVSDRFRELIYERSYMVSFAKEELLQEEGKLCNSLFFIAGGFCASYYSTVTKECILGFFEEGQFCTSWYSFESKRKSFMAIKAVVDTAAVVISYEHYDFILRECPEFAYVICRVLSNIIQVGEERSYVLRSRSARGRVQYYKDNHDIYYLMKHVPQYSIASFLNMTPETFSKIISERDKDRK